MLKIRVELLRICNYRNFICTFLFIYCLTFARCQVVRKSVELPVKDYLASPSAVRATRDGRDQLYVAGSDIDVVRSFEVFSKHTPASALMFAGLEKEASQVGPTISTQLPLISTLGNIQRSGESKVSGLFGQSTPLPKADSKYLKYNLPKATLQPRVSSPSTKQLEEAIEQAKNQYSFPSTISSSELHDTRGSLAFGQEFIPVYTTPVPSFHQNNDAAFGYFNKFPFPLPAESGARSSQNVGFQSFQHYPPPAALKYIGPNYEDDTNPYSNTLTDDAEAPVYKNHKGADDYYQKSNEYQDYDTSYEKEKSTPYKKEEEPVYYEKESNEQNSYNPPLNEDSPKYSENPQPDNYAKEPKGQHEYGPSGREEEPSEEEPDSYYNRPPNKPQGYSETTRSEETQVSKPNQDDNPLPYIPPTKGVIGLKTLKDPNDIPWTPIITKELLDLPEQYIKEDLKKDGYVTEAPTPTTPNYEQYNKEGQNQSDKSGESNNQGRDEEESEEEEEDGEEEEGEDEEEEEEEEEEEGGSESHDDGKNENTNQVPLQPSPQYNTSYTPKPTQQYQEPGHSEAGYYDEDQTLPPGPPYYPTSYEQDARNNVGYQPPPTLNLGVTPYESYEGNVKQTWTPIIPSESSQTDENQSTPKYKSENGRWLLNGGPILKNNFGGSDLGEWGDFGKDKSIFKEESYISPKSVLKNGRGKKKYQGVQKEEQVESKDLPVEHRYNRESKEDDATRENSEEPEGIDYEPPPPPPDLDEQRARTHVSDHELPRKVPTRLRYPGGGLWAKPAPGSGIDPGFVPKKVYTQTRRQNVVRHLPRGAAVAAASTAEELINAPRLREVVSHKKIQEVYEEEGYEDTGYNHGGYKKHGESEADTQKEDSGEYQPQGDGGEPSEEEAFEDHVAQLEAVPEGDPAGQSSANRQKVVQTTVQPRLKGQWKQQTTVTNEKSMAFLDEQGKGGILTQKHPPRTLGMTGKYVDVSGEGSPAIKEVRDFPEKLANHGGVVSTHNLFTHPEATKVQGSGNLKSGNSQETANYFFPQYRDQSDEIKDKSTDYYRSNHKTSQDPANQRSLFNTSTEDNNESKENAEPSLTRSQSQLSHLDELAYSLESTPFYKNGNSKIIKHPDHVDSNKDTSRNKPKYSSRFGITREISPISIDVDALEDMKSFKRERKSRDLTAFGIDQTHILSQDEFTHPTVALRAIEDQLSQISSDSYETAPRTRQVSQASDTGRKYKEIVRDSRQSQDERTDSRRDKILNVNLRDDVNIRHPFLPRDGSGDVQIDYVQTRTRMQPSSFSSRGRKHFKEGVVELAPTTEEPITTTTPKATTAKATTTTTTTTEYTPEEPAQVLSRLRVNPFLSSIFPDQEKHEDKIHVVITTTTPKITTYRAKTTTVEPHTSEAPEETRERLKHNPFLTAVFLPKSEEEKNKDDIPSTPSSEKPIRVPEQNKHRHKEYTQLQRGSRVRPIVVVPDDSDIETDHSVKHVEQLTLAHYSGPSNGLLYQVPLNSRQRMNNLAHHLNSEGVEAMHIVVRRSADSETKEGSINVASAGTTTEIPVDTEKYPFYYSPESVNLFKYSPLRYASNPKDIPIKTAGGMEFYESRDKVVNCEEPTPPKNIVPKRQKDGEWNEDPQPKKQRLGKLGDQIDCLKLKYFGEEPLDNPFFQETLVGVPNLTTQSPDDGFGFYSDIVQNIQSDPESNGSFFEGANKKRHVDPKDNGKKSINSISKVNNNTYNSLATGKHSDGYQFEKHSEKNVEESRIANNYVSSKKKNKNHHMKGNKNDVASLNKTKDIIINKPTETLEHMHNDEGLKRPVPPIRLHQPSNVIISVRSKGTSNHPKIRLVKSSYSPYNINIKVMPMSTVGYLKSHAPLHVTSEPPTIPLPLIEQPKSIPEPLYILDTVSSEARTITKREKYPTTVTYLTLNPEGRLIHQHIRTFVPVLSRPIGVGKDTNLNTEDIRSPSSEHVLSDDRRGEPKYRVKRNDLNDKYINSQESKELKNFLLRKYADILANDKQEQSRGSQNKINRPSSTDNYNHKNKLVTESNPAKSTLVTENYPPNFNKFVSTTPITFTENYPSESTLETENYPPNFRFVSTTQRPLSENYPSKSTLSTENYPPNYQFVATTSRSLGGFLNRLRPPYSSRYTAEDPMHESPSSDVEAASVSRDGTPAARNNLPTRKPKVRFPKLTINAKIDKEKTKLLNLADTTLRISTTTTTTTEPPPSTTTRMYKPRIVYKKEYGKPIDKVVNMFAALNRPPPSTESTTSEPTTEYVPDILEPPKRARKPRPRRLQQFERRRITKEEIFRTTYSPDEIKERSDKVEIYDSIYDHPDLRGPGSMARRSRDSPAEEYQEILIYMVNPMTGVGEWKLMPVPATTISRMDKRVKDDEERSGRKPRQKSRGKSRSSLDKEHSEIGSAEQGGEAGETTIHSVVEDRETTAKPGRPRGKTRRKHGRRRQKANQSTSTSEEAPTSEFSTTLENSTSASDNDSETTPNETSSSTMHPKVILEPHKRKYFYAKI